MKRITATAAVSILGGILIHLAVLTVVHIEAPRLRQPLQDTTQVRYVGSLNRETAPSILQQAALFDSAPLFMPTRWNPGSQMAGVASLKEATEIFERFPALLSLPEFEPAFPGGRWATTGQVREFPGGPAFALSRLGRKPATATRATSPGPSIQVKQLDLAVSGAPPGTVLPASLQALAPPTMWPPVQFYFHISEGLPAGLPLLAQSSGFADWDQALQSFISSLGFYRQLNDGYYHLWVYP